MTIQGAPKNPVSLRTNPNRNVGEVFNQRNCRFWPCGVAVISFASHAKEHGFKSRQGHMASLVAAGEEFYQGSLFGGAESPQMAH